jgi:hypothetical protein
MQIIMRIYNFIISQFRVRTRREVFFLLLKLALAYFVIGEIYDDLRYLGCLIRTGNRIWPIAIIKRIIFVKLLVFSYYAIRWLKKKIPRTYAVSGLIIFCLMTSWFNGSLFGIFYWDGPYWGRVTDADTGEPLAGASVAGIWELEGYQLWIGQTSIYADIRETVTNRWGWFVIPIGRKVMPWPFCRIRLNNIVVFRPGYDSNPPRMYYVWTDEDKEKWRVRLRKKMFQLGKVYERKYSAESNYCEAFGIYASKTRIYKPIIVRLNKTNTLEEQRKVIALSLGPPPFCEGFLKIPILRDTIDKEEKRLYKNFIEK